MQPDDCQKHETPKNETRARHENADGDYQLSAVDADSPVDVLNESGPVKLPLPDQDRLAIEKRLNRNQLFRFSLIEILAYISVLSVLLALSNWLPFEIYTVGMGCIAGFLMLGFFNGLIVPRYRNLLIWMMLPTYIVSAIWLILRT